MAETLGDKQRRFTQYVALLIQFAYAKGFALTFGQTYRTPAEALQNERDGRGIANSLHTQRLAVDLNLFVEGRYQIDTEPYAPLGTFWKGLAEDCRWGGDFHGRKDGNHFSIEHEGVQ